MISKLNKKNLQKLLPPLIGLFFIYISFVYTSEEERNEIYKSLKEAKIKYILLSVLFGITSFLSRAYRWNYILNSMGYYPRLINNVLAIFVTYLANLGVPRSGEILRATIMQTYESVPFDKAFGTILAERVVDLVVLFALIILCLFLETDILLPVIREKMSLDFNKHYILVISIIFLLMIFIFKKFFKDGIKKKLSNVMFGIRDGFISLLRMNYKIQYLIHTIFIWCIYILVFYLMKFCLNGTELIDFRALLIAFIFGALSMTTTNGGIGVYPISVSIALGFYGVPFETSLAFGWLTWTVQTMVIVFFGILAFFLLPIVNKA